MKASWFWLEFNVFTFSRVQCSLSDRQDPMKVANFHGLTGHIPLHYVNSSCMHGLQAILPAQYFDTLQPGSGASAMGLSSLS
jgi:hypothetical protein